jgi:signal transduction histidine kinase
MTATSSRRSGHSISRRLTWMNLVVSGAALLLASVSFAVYDAVTFRDAMVQNLTVQAGIIGSNTVSALLFDDTRSAETTLKALAGAPSIMAAAIYDHDGELFATYLRTAVRASTVPARAPDTERTDVAWLGAQGITVVRPITFKDSHAGTVYIRSDLRNVFNRLKRYAAIVVVVLIASLAAALAISRVTQRSISEPMARLAALAQRVTQEKDYSIRATDASGATEVRVLTGAINDMLAQIQQQDSSLQESRSQLEQRVKERTAELTTINQELEAFSYSVSHDLRAPVRHVSGFVALLSAHDGSTFDDEGRRYLATIAAAAERMGRLIDDLLAFSRLGRAALSKREVNLDALVREAREEVLMYPSGRDIAWTVHALPLISADPTMLKSVLVNLLSNAVKYTGTRSRAEIEIGALAQVNGESVIFVRDNGVGFDMKYQDKLFGVFQRLHRADEFEGTGIGLANVRRIIHRHGGRVWAEATKDHGATFYFSLPIESAALPQAHRLETRDVRASDHE